MNSWAGLGWCSGCAGLETRTGRVAGLGATLALGILALLRVAAPGTARTSLAAIVLLAIKGAIRATAAELPGAWSIALDWTLVIYCKGRRHSGRSQFSIWLSWFIPQFGILIWSMLVVLGLAGLSFGRRRHL